MIIDISVIIGWLGEPPLFRYLLLKMLSLPTLVVIMDTIIIVWYHWGHVMHTAVACIPVSMGTVVVFYPSLVPSWPLCCHIGHPVNFLLLYLNMWWHLVLTCIVGVIGWLSYEKFCMAPQIKVTWRIPSDTLNSITGHTDLLLSSESSMPKI